MLFRVAVVWALLLSFPASAAIIEYACDANNFLAINTETMQVDNTWVNITKEHGVDVRRHAGMSSEGQYTVGEENGSVKSLFWKNSQDKSFYLYFQSLTIMSFEQVEGEVGPRLLLWGCHEMSASKSSIEEAIEHINKTYLGLL